MVDREDVDMEMVIEADEGNCDICEGNVDAGLLETERTCLRCGRGVCGKCGVRQYLHDGDYTACLECVHDGRL
jgi:hypothetical protein